LTAVLRHLALAAILTTALAGCAVGPDYLGPPSVAPRAESGAAFVRGGTRSDPKILSARWWETLRDPILNDITLQALAYSPDIGVAISRLHQARSEVKLQFANLFPDGSGSVLYAHARVPPIGGLLGGGAGQTSGPSSTFDLYDDSFNASWEIDVFGGKRRALEAAHDTSGGAIANLEDVQVSLSAEVATAYINLRDRQHRIALLEKAVGIQDNSLTLTKQRFNDGTATKLDLSRVETQLESIRSKIPPLKAERAVFLNELATLTGQEPGALDATLHAPRPVPLPPARVDVGDPASLLQRRPDIRAAERTLGADTAKIGQAEAKRFPSVKILGIIGLGGTKASNLTNFDNLTTLIAPQISWDFLDFGRNEARVREAEGVRDEAEAQYRKTVLGALRDAEDSLARFGYAREQVAILARAKRAADEASALAFERYRAGTAPLTDALDTQRQQISAEQDLAQAIAQMSAYYVSINKALGLGWTKLERV
jgi:NodT family efflux transporter outer membrane factor (OMF) lipoprotein